MKIINHINDFITENQVIDIWFLLKKVNLIYRFNPLKPRFYRIKTHPHGAAVRNIQSSKERVFKPWRA